MSLCVCLCVNVCDCWSVDLHVYVCLDVCVKNVFVCLYVCVFVYACTLICV